jgi:transcription-repair coupling factor (superfamily II helicase)
LITLTKVDRFGSLPDEAKDLLDSLRLKWMATKALKNMEKLVEGF